MAESLRRQTQKGQPTPTPFSWGMPLRETLHDLLRAFEALVAKEHGWVPLRIPQSVKRGCCLGVRMDLRPCPVD